MANGIHKGTRNFNAHELQMNILSSLRRQKSEVTIWLMNQASPIVGRIKFCDTYTITVSSSDGKYHLLYKHGIAGISADAQIFRDMKFEKDAEVAPEAVAEPERRTA